MPDLSLFRYRLPLVRPLPLRGRTVHVREGLLVRSKEGKHEGWGDVAPLPGFSTETIEDAEAALRSLGASPSLEELLAAESDSAMPPSVQCGLTMARWQLYTELGGGSLLDEATAGTLPLNGLLSGDAASVRSDAVRLADAGYTALKLKVGRANVVAEAALVRALHTAHPTVALRLDANRAWSFDDARRFAEALGDARIEYIEEPLADPARLADFAAETHLPVALDESLTTMAPDDLGNHNYAKAVVLKPTFLGGSRAGRLEAQATSLGMRVTWSAAFESGVGLQGLVALAATSGSRPTPAGLGTYRWLAADVFAERLPLDTPAVDVAAALAPCPLNFDRLTPVAL